MRRPTVTMLDIARHAGLSRATVSLAMQGSALLRPETRQQVLAAADALGYVYNRGAANLRKARSDIVGMVINDLTNPFFAELAVGCEGVLSAAGHVVFLSNTSESVVRQAEVMRRMREQGVAGLIICPARGTQPDAFAELHAAGIPVVQAMRFVERDRASVVIPDNASGAAAAIAHLARGGHRRIAFGGGFEDISVLEDRRGGYRAGLAAAGLAADRDLERLGAPTREFGLSIAAPLLALADPPTALLAFNDAVALGFCHGLRRLGKEPGRDVAVIGFDDVKEAAFALPALSTVAVDAQKLGEEAAAMLLAQIGAQQTRAQHYIGPAQLIIRET
jgi:LacI family transcriptional regulator